MWVEVVSLVWFLAVLSVWVLLYSYGERKARSGGES
jgi:hypothetical protein